MKSNFATKRGHFVIMSNDIGSMNRMFHFRFTQKEKNAKNNLADINANTSNLNWSNLRISMSNKRDKTITISCYLITAYLIRTG